MSQYIKSMSGLIQRAQGYHQDGLELVVTVSFDAKQFNAIAKKSNPLESGMAQIKNVVLDATGVRGIPGYSAVSMRQRWPRAKNGLKTIELRFSISEYNANELGADVKSWSICHPVDLNTTLESTRDAGHLFAKSALVSNFGN